MMRQLRSLGFGSVGNLVLIWYYDTKLKTNLKRIRTIIMINFAVHGTVMVYLLLTVST